MRKILNFRRWARAAVLSACGLGTSALLADDLCQPLVTQAPRRPVMHAYGQPQGYAVDPFAAQQDVLPVGGHSDCTPGCTDGKCATGVPECGESLCGEACGEDDGMCHLHDVFMDCNGDNWFTDCGFVLGGSAAASYTSNFTRPLDRFNGPVTYTDRANEFQLNQVNLYLDRATETSDDNPIDFGGRVEMLYGTNARFTTATGLEDKINLSHSFYDLAIPQFYGEVAVNNTKIKAGHFYSPVGYCVVDTSVNPFPHLPYTFQYGEPFTHTGVLATTQVNDSFSVGAGITRGWDSWDRSNPLTSPNLGYLGTLGYTFEDDSSLALVHVWSNEATQGGANELYTSRFLQTLVYSRAITDEIGYVFQTDYGQQVHATSTNETARWYGINQYISWQTRESVTWTLNGEWFRDEEGFRVGGFLPTNAPSPTRGLSPARSGYAGSFYQVSVGPKWQINPNMFMRTTGRVDWYDGENNNAGGLKPFDNGEKNSQFIWTTDFVVLY